MTRLASMAGVVVLAVGLSSLAGPAYGAGHAHGAVRPASGLARLERLGRGALFHDFLAARVGQGQLSGVDVRARADGWAVGSRCSGQCGNQYTLIEHWNGRRWARVTSPNVSRAQFLTGVGAVSARNAWAVGSYVTNKNEAVRTLIEHWNGRRWARVPSPNAGSGPDSFSALEAVTVVSARDAWAAGFEQRKNTVRPLLLHWNGVRWSAVPSPHRSGLSVLFSVTATSARNAWAVGGYGDNGNFMLLMHWNGVRWSLVPGPRVQGALESVSAVSARDVWAAGASCPERCNSDNPPFRALLLHWNGVRWARAASPGPGTASAVTGVSATSAGDAWAVGQYCQAKCQAPGLGSALLLLLRWNGIRWARVAGPGFGPGRVQLAGVSALSARRAWAVGVLCSKGCFRRGTLDRPLTLRWNGLRWVS